MSGSSTICCRIRVHATTKFSLFYPLYFKHPTLPFYDNPTHPLDTLIDNSEDRLIRLQHARLQVNEVTYTRALNAMKVCDTVVKPYEFKLGDYILVKYEEPQKFKAKWYRPYKVDYCMPLGSYSLSDPQGNPFVHLINGQRFVRAHINGNV